MGLFAVVSYHYRQATNQFENQLLKRHQNTMTKHILLPHDKTHFTTAWHWPLTLTYNPSLVNVKVDPHAKNKVRRSNGWDRRGQTNGRTDGQMDATKCIISPAMRSIISHGDGSNSMVLSSYMRENSQEWCLNLNKKYILNWQTFFLECSSYFLFVHLTVLYNVGKFNSPSSNTFRDMNDYLPYPCRQAVPT